MLLYDVILNVYQEYKDKKAKIAANQSKNSQYKQLTVIVKDCQKEMVAYINLHMFILSLCKKFEGNEYSELKQEGVGFKFGLITRLNEEMKEILTEILVNLLNWYENGDKFLEVIKYLLPVANFSSEVFKKWQKQGQKLDASINNLFHTKYENVRVSMKGQGPLSYILAESILIAGHEGLKNLVNFLERKMKLHLDEKIIVNAICEISILPLDANVKKSCFLFLIDKVFSHKGDAALFLNLFADSDKNDDSQAVTKIHRFELKTTNQSIEQELPNCLVDIISMLKPYLDNKKLESSKIIDFVVFLFQNKYAAVINCLIKMELVNLVELSICITKETKRWEKSSELNLICMGIVYLAKQDAEDLIHLIGTKATDLKTGINPLYVAGYFSKLELIPSLLKYGLDPFDDYSHKDSVPFLLALGKGMHQLVNDFLAAKLKKDKNQEKFRLQIKEYFKEHAPKIMSSLLAVKSYELIRELAKNSPYYEIEIVTLEKSEFLKMDFTALAIVQNNLEAVTWFYENYKDRDCTNDLLIGLLTHAGNEVLEFLINRKDLDIAKAYSQTPKAVFNFEFEEKLSIVNKMLDLLPADFKFTDLIVFSKSFSTGNPDLLMKALNKTDFKSMNDFDLLRSCLYTALTKGEKSYQSIVLTLVYILHNKLQFKIPDQTSMLSTALYLKCNFFKSLNKKPATIVNQYAASEYVSVHKERTTVTFQPPSSENSGHFMLSNIANLLLVVSKDLNQKENLDSVDWTPLSLACLCNMPLLLQDMIKKGAKLDFGLSKYALGLAAYFGFDECVNVLLENGAIDYIFDELNNYSALDLAVLGNSSKITSVLITKIIQKTEADKSDSAYLQRKIISAYKLSKPQQDEIRGILEKNIHPEIVSKLKEQNSYQIVLETIIKDDNETKCKFNPETERVFKFYDNGQLKLVKITNDALESMGDHGEQFEKNMKFNQEMKGLFGYRIKKIGYDIYKMRPTGLLGDKRVIFYPAKDKNPSDSIPVYEAVVKEKAHK